MTTPTDRDLILRARRGDANGREAFGELVTRYQTSVFNVCYRILHARGEAEDLAQEVFIRAYDRIHTFDIEREFGPWIQRVAANLCLNHLEGQEVTTELDDERDTDHAPSPESAQEVRERSKHTGTRTTCHPPCQPPAVTHPHPPGHAPPCRAPTGHPPGHAPP